MRICIVAQDEEEGVSVWVKRIQIIYFGRLSKSLKKWFKNKAEEGGEHYFIVIAMACVSFYKLQSPILFT